MKEVEFKYGHKLFRHGDVGVPPAIMDRNGHVVLALCSSCGRAESELDEVCPGVVRGADAAPPVLDDVRGLAHRPYGLPAGAEWHHHYEGDAEAIDVLDHGFVALRNIAGPTRRADLKYDATDQDPAQAARMSFGQMSADRTEEEDHRLSKYLMKNWHTSPFEMIELWLEMKMPIFVARQFVRHRTVAINEISGRYVTLPAQWYIPNVVGGKALSAKQGQEDNLDLLRQEEFRMDLNRQCGNSYEYYLFHMDKGVAAEHARMFLHLNHYTHWLWKQNFHNMLNFLRLRDHFHAQIEAQVYAKGADVLIRYVLPRSMELYDEYRRMKAPDDSIEKMFSDFCGMPWKERYPDSTLEEAIRFNLNLSGRDGVVEV